MNQQIKPEKAKELFVKHLNKFKSSDVVDSNKLQIIDTDQFDIVLVNWFTFLITMKLSKFKRFDYFYVFWTELLINRKPTKKSKSSGTVRRDKIELIAIVSLYYDWFFLKFFFNFNSTISKQQLKQKFMLKKYFRLIQIIFLI